MENRGIWTKVLAITGTVILWFPILFMVLTSVVGTARSHRLLCDYLIPAELFPAVLIGALLLLWASLRARSHRLLVGGGLAAGAVFLVGGQVIAAVSGLASGAIQPEGLIWGLVLACMILYLLAVIELGIAGILVIRKLFR